MALDTYLLENPPDIPVLRFYAWNPPAVSIGYNQKIDYFNKNVFEKLGIDLVRRPTGGRAVYHDKEITYSIIISSKSELYKLGIHQLYYKISAALSAGLKYSGIEAKIERNRAGNGSINRKKTDCFSSTARFEIKYKGKKIVGSAQRRMSSGILQHGSIILKNQQNILPVLFKNSDLDIDDSKILQNNQDDELFGKAINTNALVESLIHGFEKELNCKFSNAGNLPKNFDCLKRYIEHCRIFSAHRSPVNCENFTGIN